jgi:hypothetical protein
VVLLATARREWLCMDTAGQERNNDTNFNNNINNNINNNSTR